MDYEKAWANMKEDLEDQRQEIEEIGTMYSDDLIKGILSSIIDQMEHYEKQVGWKPVPVDYKFNGWDYTELLEMFGLELLDLEKDLDPNYVQGCFDELTYKRVEHFIIDNMYNEEVMNQLRQYIKKMTKYDHNDYYNGVYKALLEIEEDTVFVQMVLPLLKGMWT